MTEAHPRWATKEQAAQHVNVNPETIDRWRDQGLVTGYRFGPRLIRYDLNEIDAMSVPTAAAASVEEGV